MQWVRIIVVYTPPYVWVCVLLLLFLGVRRLKTRRVHLAATALPTFGFLALSLVSASLLDSSDWKAAAPGVAVSFSIGVWAARLRPAAQPARVRGLWFDRPGSPAPLAAYMMLFMLHYALGIWAGFVPDLAGTLGLVRLTISAATTGWSIASLAICWRTVKSHDECRQGVGSGMRADPFLPAAARPSQAGPRIAQEAP
jgi:hypothetical protein